MSSEKVEDRPYSHESAETDSSRGSTYGINERALIRKLDWRLVVFGSERSICSQVNIAPAWNRLALPSVLLGQSERRQCHPVQSQRRPRHGQCTISQRPDALLRRLRPVRGILEHHSQTHWTQSLAANDWIRLGCRFYAARVHPEQIWVLCSTPIPWCRRGLAVTCLLCAR